MKPGCAPSPIWGFLYVGFGFDSSEILCIGWDFRAARGLLLASLWRVRGRGFGRRRGAGVIVRKWTIS